MADFYPDIKLEKYVVMPNHVHLLLHITAAIVEQRRTDTVNSKVSKFVGTFKRFCNRECGIDLRQSRSYDHMIRGERDYLKVWQYMEAPPAVDVRLFLCEVDPLRGIPGKTAGWRTVREAGPYMVRKIHIISGRPKPARQSAHKNKENRVIISIMLKSLG